MRKTIFSILIFFCAFLSMACFAASDRYIPLLYRFSGVSDPAVQKNITHSLENLYSKIHTPLTDAERQHFLVKAPIEIQNAITPYGYFRSKITPSVTKQNRQSVVNFAIKLGPALPITGVHFELLGPGKEEPFFTPWLAHKNLQVGNPLHTEDYEHAKNEIYNLAMNHGYFEGKLVAHKIEINLNTYQSTITLVFDTGSRAEFGDTTFSPSPFHEKFLQRFLTYHEGNPYDAKALESTQQALISSTLFDQVLMQPNMKAQTSHQVPIYISLLPRKAKEYIFGLGFGSDTGIRGTAGVTLRHIGGDGQRFQTMLRGSQYNSTLVARYFIPGSNPALDLWMIGAGATHINQASGTARNGKVGVEYSWRRGHWKHAIEFAYLNEKYNITTLPSTSTELLYPTWTSTYLNTDRPMNPNQGMSLVLQATGAVKAMASQTNFTQVSAHLKTLYTLNATKTRFLFRADGGHTVIADIVNLPLSLQLLAGGATSIRGYSYNSIGPGRNLLVSSAEIQQRVYGDFYFAWFIDAGNAADGNLLKNINAGTGPGLAWLSPIGMLEITLAQAFTVPGNPHRVQFTMGSSL